MEENEMFIEYHAGGTNGDEVQARLQTNAINKITLVRKKPNLLGCSSLPGVTFEFGISFIRPTVVDHLGSLMQMRRKYPNAKIVIFGHTDKVGGDQFNKELSERRAKSVYAFITNQENEWENLYGAEKWGIRIIQTILKDFGGVYDPGPVTGSMNAATKQAIYNFQRDHAPPATGDADSATRKAIFKHYMTGKHDINLTADNFLSMPYAGCSEFNPHINTQDACEANRRVVFFFFDPNDAPDFSCKLGSIAPCKKQMAKKTPRHNSMFRCAFYDSISRDCTCEQPIGVNAISLLLHYPTGLPVADTTYTVKFGSTTRNGKTNTVGALTESIPAGIKELYLTINKWQVKVVVTDIQPASVVEGAKVRLNNLGFGFHSGNTVDNKVTAQYTDAVKRFQAYHKLTVNGTVDTATKDKLEQQHGF